MGNLSKHGQKLWSSEEDFEDDDFEEEGGTIDYEETVDQLESCSCDKRIAEGIAKTCGASNS